MKAKIEFYGNDVIGIMLEYEHLPDLLQNLIESFAENRPCLITADCWNVAIRLSSNELSTTKVIMGKSIDITLSETTCNELLTDIKSHCIYSIPFPFDFSLESSGVQISPSGINDIVIETTWPLNQPPVDYQQ